ncbi:class I SAM-dependent methyltransferase [Thermomonas sp. HDW16]|uniref:class I SAM-dependent methyltransferase n=1 Tax=Thermomonas sp. HDW16 TaxID=2714945 RepID=UPI00140AA61B|nr:class I SAM-dependent methyltransferase [Thermomonas sp. HDW16]QIL21431.1 methyltransferase domain-containing protein [Thermomonas sp. HDW16]
MAEHQSLRHDEVRRFYDTEYYTGLLDGSRVPWHMRRIASRLGPLHGRSVLDVACGTGAWLGELAGHGAIPTGIDISARAIAAARARLPVADLREGVAEKLSFEDGSFDLVTCMGSLEHFLDQPRALREMRRVVRPGAQVLILVPNADFLTRRLGLYQGTGQVAVRETVRTLEQWACMIRGAGFAIDARWRDLHTLDWHWIRRGSPLSWPLRGAQAFSLVAWPVAWQYQVYFHGVAVD